VISVKRKVRFVRQERGRKSIRVVAQPPAEVQAGRVPRISRLMALAIRFDRLIRDGVASDLSELARLCHVTQPRMTQIMNLNHLAPDIQEALLYMPRCTEGRERVHERSLRLVSSIPCWLDQRKVWIESSSHVLDAVRDQGEHRSGARVRLAPRLRALRESSGSAR